jgi:predicted amidohydrolase YtcJ
MKIENAALWPDTTPVTIETDGKKIVRVSTAQRVERQVLPAYVDNHLHIIPAGLDLLKPNLYGMTARNEVFERLLAELPLVPQGGWLVAVQYDQNRFDGQAHITREELDRISATVPIVLRHASNHASVSNTAALELAGVGPDKENPKGGEYERDEAGNLTGLALETAHDEMMGALPAPTHDELVSAILAAGESMRQMGIVCAADLMTGRFGLAKELAAYQAAAEQGCAVRLRLYVQYGSIYGRYGMPADDFLDWKQALDTDAVRISGVKLFADGAIGAQTAAIYGAYAGKALFGEKKTSGICIYPPEELARRVRKAAEDGYQVTVHAIGDYAVDIVMDAMEEADFGVKHRIEHAMLLSDEQIERMKKLGVHCTMQPEFLSHFGEMYRRTLGDKRGSSIKRFRSVAEAGIPLSLSSDRPIVTGNPALTFRNATDRPEGFSKEENLEPVEALRSMTKRAWEALGEEGHGVVAEGEPADLLVYEEGRVPLVDEPTEVVSSPFSQPT